MQYKQEAALDLPDSNKDSKRTEHILTIKKKTANVIKSVCTAFVPAFKMLHYHEECFIPVKCYGASERLLYTTATNAQRQLAHHSSKLIFHYDGKKIWV